WASNWRRFLAARAESTPRWPCFRKPRTRPEGARPAGRHLRVRFERFQRVAAPFRIVCNRQAPCDLWGGVADAAGCASRSVRLKRGQNETLISPSETKRFAGHAVSHWNPYERRIRHFAGSFVFKSLAPFSFRRFHGAPVFNGLAP